MTKTHDPIRYARLLRAHRRRVGLARDLGLPAVNDTDDIDWAA